MDKPDLSTSGHQDNRIGQRVPVRKRGGTAAQEFGHRPVSEPQLVARDQIANGRQSHHPGKATCCGMPGGTSRQPMPRCCPESEVPSCGMSGDQHPAWIDKAARGRLGKAGQDVDSGRNVVERARPAAVRLAGPAELGRAHSKPVGRERGGQRPGMRPVVSGAPEAAVQKEYEWDAAPARLAAPVRHGKPQVSDMIFTGAVSEDHIRPGRWPGENVTRFRGNSPARQCWVTAG